MDAEKLASVIAEGSYHIDDIHRLIIQPHSMMRDFRTRKHGFLFVVSGNALFEIDDTVYELQPGSLFHAAPGEVLYTQVQGHAEFKYFLVFYKPKQSAAKEENAILEKHFHIGASVNPLMHELLMQLHQQNHPSEAISRLRSKELFMGIMYQMFLGSRQASAVQTAEEQTIAQAVDYINSHYMYTLTLDELAVLHQMSSKSFSYYFHKYVGARPIDFLIEVRLNRACKLLEMGQYTVHDIAASVGYVNPLYFSRVFKNKYGMSPSQYTKMHIQI